MPSLTALAAQASGQVIGHDHPVLRSKLKYRLSQDLVFLSRPGAVEDTGG